VAYHGVLDQTVPIDSSQTGLVGSRWLYEFLNTNDVCTELSVLEDGGHGIYRGRDGEQFRVSRAARFFKSIFCAQCSSLYTNERKEPNCSEILTTTDQLSSKEIMIHPNPGSGIITLSIPGYYKVEIYTLQGQKLYSKIISESTVDVSDLTTGTYVLVVYEGNHYLATLPMIID